MATMGSESIVPPSHNYYAQSGLLVGYLRQPVELKIEDQAFVSLDGNGSYLFRHMGGYSADRLISFGSGYTRVSGHYSRQHGWTTLATAVLEGLNILDVVTADRVVAQVSTELSAFDNREPSVTFLGTRFENLRLGGYPVEVELELGICGDKPGDNRRYLEDRDFLNRVGLQIEGGRNTSGFPDWWKRYYEGEIDSFHRLRERANRQANDEHDRHQRCSLVKSIRPIPIPGVKMSGNSIFIPDFGILSLGEVVVGESMFRDSFIQRENLTYFSLEMLDLQMGSIAEGKIRVASTRLSGGARPTDSGEGRRFESGEIKADLESVAAPSPGPTPPGVDRGLPTGKPARPPGVSAQSPEPREPRVTPIPPSETERFTDLAVYEGHLYASDLAALRPLSDEVPLAATRPYTLEVAIRRTRRGIDATKNPSRSVENPRQDKENLTVYVVAKPDPTWRGIEIKESLARITWPYDSDSDSALFRLEVKPVGRSKMSQGYIDVRLYDRSLDLLDIVRVLITVVPRDPGSKGISGIPPRRLFWPDKKAGVPHLDPGTPVRNLSIHVSPSQKGYQFDYIFPGKNGADIEIPVVRDIRTQDLENLLVKVRDFWTNLVITNYADQLSVTRATFGQYLGELAELGEQAWSLLFGTRYADQTGSSERLGELLATMELGEGGRLQITYGGSPNDFVFPWSILYPPTSDSAAVDALHFWGARYQIEQVTNGPREDELSEEPISVVFALDAAFGNSASQTNLFDAYEAAAGRKLSVTDPISDQMTLFRELGRNPSAHLIYFYCHGYTSPRPGVLRPDGAQLLKKRIEALEQGSPERGALETLLSLTAKMGDESWIYIGGAEIKESKLKRQKFFERRRPIVFLNMCQSADLLPSISSGLVHVFLEHNASAVIGTESPMTSVFANAFARVMLDELFGGSDIGTALWKSRRHFLTNAQNPLGLAYTLYGRSVARLGTGPVINAAAHSSSSPLNSTVS